MRMVHGPLGPSQGATSSKRSASASRSLRVASIAAVLGISALQTVGCADGGDDHDLSEPLTEGSQGSDVAELHQKLAQYGFLPNKRLAEQYPRWKPAVADAPAQLDTFDHQTALAVRAFQRANGIAETGALDHETRASLHGARCATPDLPKASEEADDAHRKWATHGTKWATTSLKWKVNTFSTLPNSTVTTAQVQSAAAAAFASWAAVTSLTFTQSSSSPDIVISMGTVDNARGGGLAQATSPEDGGDITMDRLERWNTDTDAQSVLVHEIGHALGLDHSSIAGASLFPSYTVGSTSLRTLERDDKVAISSLYDSWQHLPGVARDVAIGGFNSSPTAWVVGDAPWGDGFSVHRWNGSDWAFMPNAPGAVRIALNHDTLEPWVVTASGNIFRGSSNGATWTQIPGCAKDIGGGSKTDAFPSQSGGDIWVIGCAVVPGGWSIHHWNGSFFDPVEGGATRIAVDFAGVPYLVNKFNEVFRRVGNGWETIGTKQATDIAVGRGGVIYIVGLDGYLWVRNEQPAGTEGGPPPPYRNRWEKMTSSALNPSHVAAGLQDPWYVDYTGAIYRSVK